MAASAKERGKTDAKKTKYIRVPPRRKRLYSESLQNKGAFRKQNKPFVINIPALNKKEQAISIAL